MHLDFFPFTLSIAFLLLLMQTQKDGLMLTKDDYVYPHAQDTIPSARVGLPGPPQNRRRKRGMI
jgi:hypothetical protein